MAAQETCREYETWSDVEPHLRVIRSNQSAGHLRYGDSLVVRRARRARVLRRRRFVASVAVLAVASIVLAVPGHVLGATTGAGLPTDFASSTTLASGMEYVVQPGDSVTSIARAMNPLDPSMARSLLVHELRSNVVVAGERVLIP